MSGARASALLLASAHSTQAVYSQTSVTSLSTLTDDQGCDRFYVSPGGYYRGIYYTYGSYVTACGRAGYYGMSSRVYVPSGYYRGIYYPYGSHIVVCQ